MKFNSSSGNYAKYYMVSDQPDLTGALYGYFLKIGGAEDEVSLYRQDGSSEVEIIDGLDKLIDSSNVEIRLKVTRDSLSNWRIYVDLTGDTNYVIQGNIIDSNYVQSSYSGVSCIYTSSRSDKFYFDDFIVSGISVPDVFGPRISTLNIINDSTLELTFNESLDSLSAVKQVNYNIIPDLGMPDSIGWDMNSSEKVTLFLDTLIGKSNYYTLYVDSLMDSFNNMMNMDSLRFLNYSLTPLNYQDVRINEIMADPTPSVGLPEKEFMEIFNVSKNIIDLDGWAYTDGSKTAELDHYYLLPGEHLILCKSVDTADFVGFGSLMSFSTASWPSLNNSGDSLTLKDSTGTLIDSVVYTNNWYADDTKDGGGWSIELINPNDTCPGPDVWGASSSFDGGTPGSINANYDTLYIKPFSGLQQVNVNDIEKYSIPNSEGSTYLWTVSGGLPLSGQNTNELEIEWTNSGQALISVTETNALGCVREPVYYIVNVSAITGLDVRYIPSLNQLTFNKMPFFLNDGIVEVRLYDIMGQVVYYKNMDKVNNISLNGLSSGIYFILLKHNDESLLKKLILSN
jgi:hypothetical protein